jgi:predicted RNA binding protein YcfA (HicA-like mRNA interferase family)
MAKLPRNMSGRDLVKHLEKIGYAVDHQRGSHIIMKHGERPLPRLSVPDHKTVRIGLLRNVIRDAGLTPQDFEKLLK